MTRKTKSDVDTSAMPKTSGTSAATDDANTHHGFVNINLEEDEKTYYTQWAIENETEVWNELTEILLTGLKISIKNDAANDCFIASLTGKGARKFPLFNLTISARASSWTSAVSLLVFKHVVLAETDWSKYWTEKRRFGSEI